MFLSDHAGVDNSRSPGVGLLRTVKFEPVAKIERHRPQIVLRDPQHGGTVPRRGIQQCLSDSGAMALCRYVDAEQLTIAREVLALRSEAGAEEREADDTSPATWPRAVQRSVVRRGALARAA